jgi:hypothetical protein
MPFLSFHITYLGINDPGGVCVGLVFDFDGHSFHDFEGAFVSAAKGVRRVSSFTTLSGMRPLERGQEEARGHKKLKL